MESMLPRFIHLLAHHPDFNSPDRGEEDLLIFALYFEFYFDCVVTADSLPLVYHYAQRIKQVEDSTGNDAVGEDVFPVMTFTNDRTSTSCLTSHRW